MSATRKAYCNNIHCDSGSDLPAAGQWVGQIAWVFDDPVEVYRWNGSSWIDVTPNFPGTGGGSGTDPLTLSPYYWLIGDDVSGNDGDPVTTWPDASGNGRDFGQSTAGKKPVKKVANLNGHDGVQFDGGDCLTRASVAITTFVKFAVFANTASAIIWEQGPTTAANDGIACFSQNGDTIGVRKGGVKTGRDAVSTWGTGGNPMLAVQWYDGTHALHNLFINDVTGNQATGSATGNPGTGTTTDTMNLGARNNAASLGLVGNIWETGLFTPVLTLEEIRSVILFLQLKYNL